jgi:UrcA family protein
LSKSTVELKEYNMRKTFLVYYATFLALTATGLVINTDLAVAQQGSGETEEVVVIAPVERHQVVGRSGTTGAPMELIELRRQVSYADLDLSKSADVTELETRIEASAKESCEKLSRMFPTTPSDWREIQSCTKKAINSAEEAKKAAIAAAE